MKNHLRVLFEDNHLLALEKPPGVLTQADRTGDESLFERAKSYLKEKYQKPGAVYLGMVHRLDRPTGGVVLFCRTSKAAGRVSEQFRARSVKKTYLAACAGTPKEFESLRHFLSYQEKTRKTMVFEKKSEDAQEAKLSYRLIARGKRHSLLEVTPVTGRKHQIRAQLAHIGHPLLNDRKYGGEHNGESVVKAVGLWAHRLEILHPVKKEPLSLISWPPVESHSLWSEFSSSFSL